MSWHDSRKQSTQAGDTVSDSNATGLDARKKPRTVNDDPSVGEYLFASVHDAWPRTCFIGHAKTEAHRRSSRANKGHGGQIAQLHNIERIQTESSSKASHNSQLKKATANELINPMAPERPRPKVRTKTSKSTRADESGLKSVCNVRTCTGFLKYWR